MTKCLEKDLRIEEEEGMRYTDDRLNDIYERTRGYCHLCWKKLSFCNYGKPGMRAAWEVEHSCPRAK